MNRSPNLASRPFRNQTLPKLVFALASIALVAVSVAHALVVRRLLPARTSALHREVAGLEAEAARLRTDAAGLKVSRPETAVVVQWTLVKDLVDRRAFRWTELFAVLEDALPASVRLVSVSPDVKGGVVRLELTAVARSAEAGLELVRALEERPEFPEVYPLSVSTGRDGEEFRYTVVYRPAPTAPGVPAPSAHPEPGARAADRERAP